MKNAFEVRDQEVDGMKRVITIGDDVVNEV